MIGHSRFAFLALTAVLTTASVLTLTDWQQAKAEVARDIDRKDLIERGRYLTRIGGCNDCHTAGFMLNDGQVAESQWLTGDSIGWRGPWGTTYALNLRLYLDGMTEEQWIARARSLRTRPPMPFWALNEMSDEDLGAFYHFVRSLGPKGEHAPAYVPPDQEPFTPYFDLVPRMPVSAEFTPSR